MTDTHTLIRDLISYDPSIHARIARAVQCGHEVIDIPVYLHLGHRLTQRVMTAPGSVVNTVDLNDKREHLIDAVIRILNAAHSAHDTGLNSDVTVSPGIVSCWPFLDVHVEHDAGTPHIEFDAGPNTYLSAAAYYWYTGRLRLSPDDLTRINDPVIADALADEAAEHLGYEQHIDGHVDISHLDTCYMRLVSEPDTDSEVIAALRTMANAGSHLLITTQIDTALAGRLIATT